mgnify:FL=1
MVQCPKCGNSIKVDFGMVTCSKCRQIVFLDMDGNVQPEVKDDLVFPSEGTVVGDFVESSPAEVSDETVFADSVEGSDEEHAEVSGEQDQPANEVADDYSFTDETVVAGAEEAAAGAEDVAMPEEEVTEEVAEEMAAEENPADEEFAESVETDPELQPQQTPVAEESPAAGSLETSASREWAKEREPSKYANEDLREIQDYGNSEVSVGKDGQFVYDLRIGGIDSQEIKKMVEESITDKRLSLNIKGLMKSIKGGVLEIRRINAIKTSILVNRLKSLPVTLHWRQNVITQINLGG